MNKISILVAVLVIGVVPVMAASRAEKYYSAGYTSFTQGKYEAAAIAYQQAVKLNPKSGLYHVALGCALGARNNDSAAIVELRTGVADDSSLDLAYYLIEGYYARIPDYEGAAAYFESTATGHPQNPVVRLNWGYSLYRLGNLIEARNQLAKAVELDPRFADAWCGLGLVDLALRDNDPALAALDSALTIEPGYPEARLYRSAALRRLGRTEEADRERELAIQEKPELASVDLGGTTARLRGKEMMPLLAPALDAIAFRLLRPEERAARLAPARTFTNPVAFGVTAIDKEVWYSFSCSPALNLKYFGTELDLNILINNRNQARTKELNIHKIMHNIHVGAEAGPLLLMAGRIDALSYGYGFLMNGYMNQADENNLKTGGRFELAHAVGNTNIGLSTMTNNFEKPELVAGRAFFERWSPKDIPSLWHEYALGVTVATDIDQNPLTPVREGVATLGADGLVALNPNPKFHFGLFTEWTQIMNHGTGGVTGLFLVKAGTDTLDQLKAMVGGYFAGREFEPAFFDAFYERDRLLYAARGTTKSDQLTTLSPGAAGGLYAVFNFIKGAAVNMSAQSIVSIGVPNSGALSLKINLAPNDKFDFEFAANKTALGSVRDLFKLDDNSYINGLIGYKFNEVTQLQIGYLWTYAWDETKTAYVLQRKLTPAVQVNAAF